MNSNQQNGSKQDPQNSLPTPDQGAPVTPQKAHMPQQNFLQRLAGIFMDASRRFQSDHVSKHAAGHTGHADKAKTNRRARNKAARATRKVQRRRDHSSSKRRRS